MSVPLDRFTVASHRAFSGALVLAGIGTRHRGALAARRLVLGAVRSRAELGSMLITEALDKRGWA